VQITRESSPANVIRAYEPGRVRVNERWLAGNVIVSQDQVLEPWTAAAPGELTLADLEPALAMQPEIVLLGTGAEVLLPDVDLMAALAQRGVGLEIMSTAAACRTFNVLVHEQRRVAVALFNPPR
jgi:uncharacterized protein